MKHGKKHCNKKRVGKKFGTWSFEIFRPKAIKQGLPQPGWVIPTQSHTQRFQWQFFFNIEYKFFINKL